MIHKNYVFRLSICISLSIVIGYGFDFYMPFMAPLLSFLLGAKPGPKIPAKGLIGLVILFSITLSLGLLLIPLLEYYALTAIFIVIVAIYLGNHLTLNLNKGLVGTLLIMGFTLISAAGTVDFGTALDIIKTMVLAIIMAVALQWLIYPLFPVNEPKSKTKPQPENPDLERWVIIRATCIILPVYLFTLTNPLAYMATIMKSVSLAQQVSEEQVKGASFELLMSTLLGGLGAVVFWFMLSIMPNLYMFALITLLFSLFFISRLYQIYASRFSPSMWQNAFVTMLIIIGPAVQDTESGKDVLMATVVRVSLFLVLTFYAMFAVQFLEFLRKRQINKKREKKAKGALC